MHPTLSDHLLEIVQNAFEAGATDVGLKMVCRGPRVAVEVLDNGRGMDEATLRRALDPFSTDGQKHPGREVGLGLPFLEMAVEQSAGELQVTSAPGQGTRVRFGLDRQHVDTPPLGDLAGTLALLMNNAGRIEFRVHREEDGHTYQVCRSELEDALGELESAGSLALMKQFFVENEAALPPGNA